MRKGADELDRGQHCKVRSHLAPTLRLDAHPQYSTLFRAWENSIRRIHTAIIHTSYAVGDHAARRLMKFKLEIVLTRVPLEKIMIAFRKVYAILFECMRISKLLRKEPLIHGHRYQFQSGPRVEHVRIRK